MKFAYGITTVPSRFDNVFARTLESLQAGGFDRPRIFVDGCTDDAPYRSLGLPVTTRDQRIRTWGNWVLAIWELYLRDPRADRYLVFQDDLVCVRDLRLYLERAGYPDKGYCNLYTFPENQRLCGSEPGWYRSNQQGKGAVALMFSRDAVAAMLRTSHFVNRCQSGEWKRIDGGIVDSLKSAGWREHCHNPSLVQHTGAKSSMGNCKHPSAPTFPGEEFSAAGLVVTPPAPPPEIRVIGERPRIGLVGYSAATGLGEVNRQLAQHLPIASWLVCPHQSQPTLPNSDAPQTICQHGDEATINRWLDAVDVVLWVETPYFDPLPGFALRKRKRIVCIPMLEWLPDRAKWPRKIDLHLSPTRQCHNELQRAGLPSVHTPWPVDTERFAFRQRTTCERFLFLNGHGGWNGRKGASVVCAAKRLWPEMPLLVRSQVKVTWSKGTTVLPRTDSNADLYAEGDVLLCPHTVDGLGLEPMEAMAAGMPVVSTDGEPWNEIPAIGKIAAKRSKRRINRPMPWYTCDPQSLVDQCRGLLGADISEASAAARAWAESRAWASAADTITDQLRQAAESHLQRGA